MSQDESTLYDGRPIDGTEVFTVERAAAGYRLNKLAASLSRPRNRELFLADEDAYCERYRLDAGERELVRRRDWMAMVEHGATVYLILRIAATVGSNLIEMGAQMRGETVEDFMRTRPGVRAVPRRS